jgi:hypothetical protein
MDADRFASFGQIARAFSDNINMDFTGHNKFSDHEECNKNE